MIFLKTPLKFGQIRMRIYLTQELAVEALFLEPDENKAKTIAIENNLYLFAFCRQDMSLLHYLHDVIKLPLTEGKAVQYAWYYKSREVLCFILEKLFSISVESQEVIQRTLAISPTGIEGLKTVIEDFHWPVFLDTIEMAVYYNNIPALCFLLQHYKAYNPSDSMLTRIAREDFASTLEILLPYFFQDEQTFKKFFEMCCKHDAYKCLKILIFYVPTPISGHFLCVLTEYNMCETSKLSTLLLLSKGADASYNNFFAIRHHTNYYVVEILVESLLSKKDKSLFELAEQAIPECFQKLYFKRKPIRHGGAKKIYYWWIPICYNPNRENWKTIAEKGLQSLIQEQPDFFEN